MSDGTVWFVTNPSASSYEAFREQRDAEERGVELTTILSDDGGVYIGKMNERVPTTYVTYDDGCMTVQQFEVQ